MPLCSMVDPLLQQHPQTAVTVVLTEGGAYIAGAVDVAGDFVNRDQRE